MQEQERPSQKLYAGTQLLPSVSLCVCVCSPLSSDAEGEEAVEDNICVRRKRGERKGAEEIYLSGEIQRC